MRSQSKAEQVEEMTGLFAKAHAAFVVDYTKCTCAELTVLRRQLKAKGGRLGIVKNTLAKRAVKAAGQGTDQLSQFFQGQTAVIWADKDPVSPAKILSDFVKAKETFTVRGGVVDGALVSSKEVEALSKLPSKEELWAQLLSVMNAPATRLVQTINEPGTRVARILEAWRSKLETKS